MELLTPHQLQIICQRILNQCTPIGDCLVWSKTINGKPVKHEPKFQIAERGSKRLSALALLWYREYGEWPPRAAWHQCEHKQLCFNLNHKKLAISPPRVKSTRFYRFTRHTDQCPGIDWILIERLVSTGTMESIARDHKICDCERAYLVQHTDFPIRELQIKSFAHFKRLTQSHK